MITTALRSLALLLALPAFATSFVMVSDPELAAQADAIVVGRIVAVEPRSDDQRPRTRYTVEVEEVVQGSIATKSITVTVPGGIAKNGRGLVVHGAPAFLSGERTILFLERNADGFTPLHLMLGAFREQGRLATRDFSGAAEIGSASAEHRPRDFAKFTAWLRDTSRPRDYFVDLPHPRARVTGQFTLFDIDGFSFRWFEFQWDNHVEFRIHELAGSDIDDRNVENVQRALAVWSDNPGTLIDYRYAGRTTAQGGFTEPDGVNTVLFGDPNNDVPGRYRCLTGGVLAVGGSWFMSEGRIAWGGKERLVALESEVIVNDGMECLFDKQHPDLEFQETLAHELGHTLGFDHSCGDGIPCTDPKLDEALMRAFIHGGDRGPVLAEDDRNAATSLYEPVGPRVGFTVSRDLVRPNEPLRFAPTRALEGVTYAWTFGDGAASSEASPEHTYAKPGVYEIRLRATDASGTNEIVRLLQVYGNKQRSTRR
ncbi:MAG TPA: PKD domain-containing protein [Thermoanaerobaculia bacterium]|jgi:hypothetical protein